MIAEAAWYAVRVAWLAAAPTGGLLCHALVCRFRLFPRLAWPIDRGLRFRGRRLIGDNKTFRGFVVVMVGTALFLGLQIALARHVEAIARLGFVDYRDLTWWFHGPIYGSGWVIAELPNSFIKRQIEIGPGQPGAGLVGGIFTVVDLVDGVFGLLASMCVFYVPSLPVALAFFAAMTVIHVLFGFLLVALGVKTRPL